MKLSQLGEFSLIEEIRRATPVGHGVRIGIGDDAAWVDNTLGSSLVTADLLVEGVHFNLKWTSMFELGYKSLAVNLSDIAAMGGVPGYVILSLGIPAHFDSKQVALFYQGIFALAKPNRVSLVGGDTNVAKSLTISVCVIGHAPYPPIRRNTAQVGDDIYVTGTLGDAALALKFLLRRKRAKRRGALAQLLRRHHRPTPRLAAGAALARRKLATAMIDISDGLLQDLGHICKASGIGASVWKDQLPLSRAYRTLAGKDGIRYALSGGEDYELLFCARPRDRARVRKLEGIAHVPITRIGTCVPAPLGIDVVDDSGKSLHTSITGHDHFTK
jgi:thiamine-monophosphate kinase